MGRKNTAGHLAAIITVLIWGVTYISTKVLLREFQPMEILFFRFLSGFVALLLVYPRRLKLADKKQELLFIMAGLCGVCLYPLLDIRLQGCQCAKETEKIRLILVTVTTQITTPFARKFA